jgi:hypothetical protein
MKNQLQEITCVLIKHPNRNELSFYDDSTFMNDDFDTGKIMVMCNDGMVLSENVTKNENSIAFAEGQTPVCVQYSIQTKAGKDYYIPTFFIDEKWVIEEFCEVISKTL